MCCVFEWIRAALYLRDGRRLFGFCQHHGYFKGNYSGAKIVGFGRYKPLKYLKYQFKWVGLSITSHHKFFESRYPSFHNTFTCV